MKTAEKLSILLSTVAFASVIMAIALVLIVFITIGVGHLLATSIAPHMAYLIVAGFYLLLLIVAVLLRKRLFINPIARFMSRLLVEPPKPESENQSFEETSGPDQRSPKETSEIEIDYDELARHVVSMLEKQSQEQSPVYENDDINQDCKEEE